MVLHWHSKGKAAPYLYFQKEGEGKWFQYQARSTILEGSKVFINSLELTSLEPNTRYAIQFEKRGHRYYFRTLPHDFSRPLRFAVGGDLFLDFRSFKRMNRQVISTDPDFIVLGGDLAYAQKPKAMLVTKKMVLANWESFFRNLKTATITTENRIIPILPIVGNHDISKIEKKEKNESPFFYQFFPHTLSYRLLKVSSEICLFLLDTGHIEAVEGPQKKWLEETLKQEADSKYKIPLYHVAAYPSCYSFENARAQFIRDQWVPLFEQYKVKFAFEHHNHAFKRTVPLKENKQDSEGVVYLGDGSWGVPPRDVKPHWYLEKAAKLNCFWLVILDRDLCRLQAFDLQGNLIDDLVIQ